MDKELRALNKLINKCNLAKRNGKNCSECINLDICEDILGELPPLPILEKLQELKIQYPRIK